MRTSLSRKKSTFLFVKSILALVLLLSSMDNTFAQSTIKGIVKTTENNPIEGVSITIKGTSITTVSNNNGEFIISSNNAIQTLVFSNIGYKIHEENVSGKSSLEIILEEINQELEDIVVVGFGTQKKSDLIGSVTSIKPSELKIPSSNLTTALAGRAAGVIGFQRSGEPGADNADFFIRGVTTFGYKVDPLILIDNVEVTTTDLARLQVDDIETFNIMKDATATAIYGARGANGVILITTKEGKEAPVSLNVRMENSFSTPTSNVELTDPITYMNMYNEAILTRNPLVPIKYSLEQIEKTQEGLDPLIYPTVNWREMLLKDYTTTQRLNLSVSGGGKVAKYFVSGALNQDNGILKVPQMNNFNSNINLKTYSLRSNVNINLTKTTDFAVRLNGSFDDYIGPIDGGTKVYRDIMRSNPTLFLPYYEPIGNYQFLKHIMFGNSRSADGLYINPYAEMVRGYKEYSRSMMLAQLELKQKLDFITEGLNFRAMANTTRNSFFSISRDYNPFYYQLVPPNRNSTPGEIIYDVLNENGGSEYLDYSEGSRSVSSLFYMEAALNYNKVLNEKHNLSGLLVTILRNELKGATGSLQQSLPYRNMGLSGRFTYGYDSRYHIEFNFGYNGSERFHESQRFGFFPSAGFGWTISNEKFWDNYKDVVNNFRIRGTYGIVGNDAIGSASDRFYYLSEINMNNSDRGASFGIDRSYTRNGISVNRYSNEDITWESAYKSNIALELGLFNRFKLIADFFHEHRKNIFMTRSAIPQQMGLATSIAANVGEAVGKGIDGSIEYNRSFSNGFWLQAMGNFTFARSTYLKYEEPDYPNAPNLSRIGKPVNGVLGYVAERLFIDDAEVANSPEQTFGIAQGGDIKFKDINGDGYISTLDRTYIGKPTVPEINYGFGVSLGYKKIDISVFFQGLAEESFWLNTSATSPFRRYVYSGESVSGSTILENQVLKSYADSYWSENNRDIYAIWPRLTTTANENNERSSTWFMRDGDFLRLKQLELGFNFSQSFLERYKMKKLRVYASGTNLFIWSKFKDWDAEMAGNGLGYPLQKVFNIGIQTNL